MRGSQKQKQQPIEKTDDHFLATIKSKGFCIGKTKDMLLKGKCMPVEQLRLVIKDLLQSYFYTGQQGSFAIYVITQFVKEQTDLKIVQQELISMWNCIEQNKQHDLIVTVYSNFLNEVFSGNHVAFFVQTQKVIVQVVNGDMSHEQDSNLANLYVKVERVVDIVDEIFKMSSALCLFEGTHMLEVPQPQLQLVITSLLQNVKIVYQSGNGHINAQDLQIQCLLEFEKLKIKLVKMKGGRVVEPTPQNKKIQQSDSKTFLGVDAILYPKMQKTNTELLKSSRRKTIFAGFRASEKPGLQGYSASARVVQNIMEQKMLEKLRPQHFHDDFGSDDSNEDERGLHLEHELRQQIDLIVSNKKGTQKKFNNNPPKKEPPKTRQQSKSDDSSDEELQSSPQKAEKQFHNFQTKLMYNQEEIQLFGSADTKMKQLQMKLRECEAQKSALSQEAHKLKLKMKSQEGIISKAVQTKLETLFVDLINDFSQVHWDYERICDKHQQSQIQLLERKEQFNKQFHKLFKVIGQETAFLQLAEDLRKGKELVRILDNTPEKIEETSSEEEVEVTKAEINLKESMSGLILGFKFN